MGADLPNASVRDWFDRRTIGAVPRNFNHLASAKRRRGTSISVCLPTLNEASTVGDICSIIGRELVEPGVVDQIVVCDTGSDDGTVEVARRAGAQVVTTAEILPHYLGSGKGAGLWKSLAAAEGDVLVWLDADVVNFHPRFVLSLIAPLLEDPTIQMTKAYYRRPDARGLPDGGGRVTEIVARPLLNLFYPELARVIQPLSGEYAMRRDLATALPFLSDYAVDIGLLIDAAETAGLNAIAQVDLDLRVHRNRDLLALGRMSNEVIQGMLRRFDELGRLKIPDLPTEMLQFEGGVAQMHRVHVAEFPPLREVPN
jgi:glucosyl-3-phosphoglycerate synthase